MKENNSKVPNEEEIVQKCIDPCTGRDITNEYIKQRLIELEKIANDIITNAIEESMENQDNIKKVYKKFYWQIHHKLGMGSIGPATAAAGPLMYSKMDELADKLEISIGKRIS